MTLCQHLSTYFIEKRNQNPKPNHFACKRKGMLNHFKTHPADVEVSYFFLRSIFTKDLVFICTQNNFYYPFSVLSSTTDNVFSLALSVWLKEICNPFSGQSTYLALLSKALFTHRLPLILESLSSLRGNVIIFSMQISILFLSQVLFIIIHGLLPRRKC